MSGTLGPPRTSATVTRAVVDDGSLVVRADRGAWPAVEPWVPLGARTVRAGSAAACIRVESAPPADAVPAGEPLLELRAVRGWLLPAERVLLAEPGGRIGGIVDLAGRRATVAIAPGEDAGGLGVEVFATLTIAAALLLTRLERALVHAAAVVAPGGGAWLLAGGSFSGKTTTCVNLIRGGWDYLADDHVVLGPDGTGGIRVEGWPRRFNLDHGYPAGASLGVRSRVDPGGFGPGRRRPAAPLAGVLFPRVQAELPTALAPLPAAGALASLLRHAPWLLADAGAARPVLGLLERAARLPAYELRLGRDSYCDAVALQFALVGAICSP
ncbi:MAG TPA: hypothetical protein VGO40_03265 [Longimicrobium sp.]|jgi:hypothetical protein|nr:hypothetical protein [Longimicrobium sp.]